MAIDKSRVLALKEKGLTQTAVAGLMNVSPQAISAFLLREKLGKYPYSRSLDKYNRSPKRRKSQKKYEGTRKGKETRKKYTGGPKFKKALKKYYSSDKGQEAHSRSRSKKELGG